ncbi:MAG: LamB/YcsF family protein [Psychroflexus sp.]|nr:LamB/YcsF family protein [Psychroflexus sp.]MDN6309365.1 LamB/YcsF family protein [Psychroflexus sp.]
MQKFVSFQKKIVIDINCDLAEGGNEDAEIMPHISSCNIACGGHFGNRATIEEAVRLAKKHQVKVGAHPSYPDRENFGRQKMKMQSQNLQDSLLKQIQLVIDSCDKNDVDFHHIKAHGALYNAMENDTDLCELFFDVLQKIDRKVVVFISPKSKLKHYKSPEIIYWIEGFGDRTYQADLSLTKRSESDALLTNPKAVFKQILNQKEGFVRSQNNDKIEQKFDTICLHSDTPNALGILRFVIQNLEVSTNK